MEFAVEDNGIGFDLAEAIAASSPLIGLGLLSIKAQNGETLPHSKLKNRHIADNTF
ncbi:MAG TPA: hypothetical protein VMV04_10850 [Thermodesulfobacteriota bacterium]|nr:hypothetical protein [Thermodesulfobacteriota bacterium]